MTDELVPNERKDDSGTHTWLSHSEEHTVIYRGGAYNYHKEVVEST